ncbi:hypothetical protein K8Z49_26085 [Actinomadura madurae]|uniref:hypothetical protein n=1 Tax=Actinomadura madurae TaxID=1993 RepID=UPI00399B177A
MPDDEDVDCQVVPDAHFQAAGHYAGGRKSTIFINGGIPFNLADLLHVVSHDLHPHDPPAERSGHAGSASG